MSVLLYGGKCWTQYRRHRNHALSITPPLDSLVWQSSKHWSTKESSLHHCWSNCIDVEATLSKVKLRRTGHMHHTCLPKILLYGELVNGQQSQEGQYKHDKDELKATLCHCHIDTTTWDILASECCLWCNTVCSSITSMKAIQVETAERQCKEQKSQISQVDSADASLTCHECGKAS